MKIVIVGDGKVGYALTEQLSHENHDIVVIDNDQEVLARSTNVFDVMGIHGNGAHREVQEEAGVQESDLLIAATSTDELNMLCCMVAKKLGAKHTIARVRDPEYYSQLNWMRDELGLSMTINPEYAAANEIFRMLRFPSAIAIDSFVNGRVDMIEMKIKKENKLIGCSLSDLRKKVRLPILVCAVQRDNKVHIPSGDFIISEGDKIHVTAAPGDIASFSRKCGMPQNKVHRVMIIGGSRIAYYLARRLLKIGIHVIIIEIKAEVCEEIKKMLPNAVVINGDATEQEVLREEGIHDVDAFVALTNIDEENMVMSMYAQEHDVFKIVAKINRRSFHNIMKKMGIDSIISPKMITADEIVQYVRAMQDSVGDKMQTLYKLVGGKVEAMEFYVKEPSDITGVPLKDLSLRKNLLIGCIVRKEKIIIPTGETKIEAGDSVIIVAAGFHMQSLWDMID